MPSELAKWTESKLSEIEKSKASVEFVKDEVNHAYDRIEDHLVQLEGRLSDKLVAVSDKIDIRMSHMASNIQEIKETQIADKKDTVERIEAATHCKRQSDFSEIHSKQAIHEKNVGNMYKWFIGALVPVMVGIISFVYITMARASAIEQDVTKNTTKIEQIDEKQQESDEEIEDLLNKLQRILERRKK